MLINVIVNLQLLDTGFFHADPHPGNLIRTPDGKLAILDFGKDLPLLVFHKISSYIHIHLEVLIMNSMINNDQPYKVTDRYIK